MNRYYGKLDVHEGTWRLTGEPHTVLTLKRIFGRIDKGEHGTVTMKDTDEVRKKIKWFLAEYPMEVSAEHQKLLDQGAARHREMIVRLDDLIGQKTARRKYEMAIPPREYQKIAAEMALERKGLLIADELGLGKTIEGLAILTEPDTLPAVIVTMSNTMPEQWRNQTWRFLPTLQTHVVKKLKPYPLPRMKGETPDVIIINYHKLTGWAETLAPYARTIIFDEVQELRRRGSLKYDAAEFIAKSMKYRVGLSVGPDAMVLVRDASGTRHLRIDDFAESVGALDDIFVPVSGVEVRSFDGTQFCWKKLKAVLRHSSEGKRTFRIHTEKGRSLVLTEDHSLYRVKANGHCWVKGSKKPLMDLELVRGDELREGDEVLLEDCVLEDKPLRELDIVDYITASRWFVNGDFSDWIEKNVTTENGYQGAYGVRHRQIVVGHRGTYVTGAQYIGSPELRAKPGRIYTQGKGGIWTSPRIPARDAAYLLGFYLGDGWVDRSRICFAIQNEGVRRFLRKSASFFKWTKCNLSIRKMPGKSVEVRFSNIVLANFITGFFRNAKAWEKQIPDEIFAFSQEDTRTFIKGLLDSDGSFSLRKTKKGWYYTTTSKELADGMVELLKKVNVVAGISKCDVLGGGVIQGRKITGRRPKYQVFFSHYEWMGCNDGRLGRRHRYAAGPISGYPARIKRIEPEETPTVFDLSVDDTQWPSFVASGILVHNSATPIFNMGGEIWNVINVLMPDSLGNWDEFVREWCYGENPNNRKAPAVSDPKALGSYLQAEHLMLRRTRGDVGKEMPEVTKIIQTVESDEKAFSQLEGKAIELAKIILSNSAKVDSFKRMRAEQEFDNRMRQATGIAKAPYIAEFIRLLVEGSGEPVVVFAWHRGVYDILLEKLKDLKPAMFTGSETVAEKQASLDRFVKQETKVLLMSLRAGQGVDGLQHVCRTVVIAELDWTDAVMEQDIGRVQRDGQKDPVTAYFLVSESGTDPIISESIGLKKSQLLGIRDPNRPDVLEVKTDRGKIKDLARLYLEKKGITVKGDAKEQLKSGT